MSHISCLQYEINQERKFSHQKKETLEIPHWANTFESRCTKQKSILVYNSRNSHLSEMVGLPEEDRLSY